MISEPDRRIKVALIDAARKSGACLIPACQTASVISRTFQRWTKKGGISCDLRPETERPPPANKLNPEERRQVLEICHQKEYRSMPPGQIVPILAETGKIYCFGIEFLPDSL